MKMRFSKSPLSVSVSVPVPLSVSVSPSSFSLSSNLQNIVPEIPEISENAFIGLYTLHEQLGSGGYANVFRAVDRQTGREVAVKMSKISKLAITLAQHEIKILRKVQTEGVASGGIDSRISELEGAYQYKMASGERCCVLIFPRLHMNLRDYLKLHKNGLQEREIFSFASQLKSAISHLHSIGIVHGDLKPANLAFTQPLPLSSPQSPTFRNKEIRLFDFGLSKEFHKINAGDLVATKHYRPPEAFCRSIKWSKSVDLWSFGVILLEFLVGQNFFKKFNSNELRRFAFMEHLTQTELPAEFYEKNPNFDRYKSSVGLSEIEDYATLDELVEDQQLLSLIKGLLDLNCEKRLTISQVEKHPYFVNGVERFCVRGNDVWQS